MPTVNLAINIDPNEPRTCWRIPTSIAIYIFQASLILLIIGIAVGYELPGYLLIFFVWYICIMSRPVVTIDALKDNIFWLIVIFIILFFHIFYMNLVFQHLHHLTKTKTLDQLQPTQFLSHQRLRPLQRLHNNSRWEI
ncbi:unnamed protein product [Caenorhabditis angaria]|uniref:Uncharacterized protein n=1 Tax=Caenorhabditis angaria TaxID=860376 RepID=A0A9P1IEZ7_9PELO|nr:unnamed protein product [Caenorhabditis angaria]